MRECSKCQELKPREMFGKDKTGRDGLRASCKQCEVGRISRWQKANPVKVQTKNLKWKLQNPDKHAQAQTEYRKKNKVYLRRQAKAWLDSNNRRAFFAAKRRARELQATPKWADLASIAEFYKNRPKGYHVDHIIPLKGKIVSGLHILSNLQYLPAEENLRKSNKVA